MGVEQGKPKTQHWLGGRSSAPVIHCDSLLRTRRGPGWSAGWQTPRHQPPRLSQGPCARGAPLPGNPEKQHFKSTSAALAPKKVGLQQSGKFGYICTRISETSRTLGCRLLCAALEKVLAAGRFVTTVAGARYTTKRLF